MTTTFSIDIEAAIRGAQTEGERALLRNYQAHLAEGGARAWQLDALADTRAKAAAGCARKTETRAAKNKRRLDRRRTRRRAGELADSKASRTPV